MIQGIDNILETQNLLRKQDNTTSPQEHGIKQQIAYAIFDIGDGESNFKWALNFTVVLISK